VVDAGDVTQVIPQDRSWDERKVGEALKAGKLAQFL
jgi:hypothetical protein